MMRQLACTALLFGAMGGGIAYGVAQPAHAAPASAHEAPVASDTGKMLYTTHCAICHASGWAHPGYNRLRERGVPVPDLEARTDLTADFVRTIVRLGLGSMPALTPTYVTNGELDAIGKYLAHQE